MKLITRLGAIAVFFTFALNGVAVAAAKEERANKYFTVAGRVLRIDNKERTLLVADRSSKKLYLIQIPDRATFKITFGRYMRMQEPGFAEVNKGERVEIRCWNADKEHLAQLEDGRVVIIVTAAG